MDRDFEIGGRKFKLLKLDAFKQFHIVRRIGPILTNLLPAIKGVERFTDVKSVEKLSSDEKLEMIASLAGPVMSGLSQLSDADSELVLFGLLSGVEIQQASGNWARVANNSMLMIQDLELPILLQIAGRALVYNLSGFFAVLSQ